MHAHAWRIQVQALLEQAFGLLLVPVPGAFLDQLLGGAQRAGDHAALAIEADQDAPQLLGGAVALYLRFVERELIMFAPLEIAVSMILPTMVRSVTSTEIVLVTLYPMTTGSRLGSYRCSGETL